MIRLGNVRHSLPSIARRAFTALHDCGRIAVYVGITANLHDSVARAAETIAARPAKDQEQAAA